MSVQITSLYAALLGLIALFLAGSVGAKRAKTKISLGDGGDPGLIVANRRHMNFVENVPLALILIGLVEMNGGASNVVHSLGGALLVARIIHPMGLDVNNMMKWQRLAGAAVTFLVMGVSAVLLLLNHFS